MVMGLPHGVYAPWDARYRIWNPTSTLIALIVSQLVSFVWIWCHFIGIIFLIQHFSLASQLFTFSHFAERDPFSPKNHIPQPNCTQKAVLTPWKMNGWNLKITHLPKKTWSSKPPLLCSMFIFRGVTHFLPPGVVFFFSGQEMVHLISSTWSLGERWLQEVITSSHKRSRKFPFLIFSWTFFLAEILEVVPKIAKRLVYKKMQGMESSRFLWVKEEVYDHSQVVHLHRTLLHHPSPFSSQKAFDKSVLVVEPTHLKNMIVKLGIHFPKDRDENSKKSLKNHHLVVKNKDPSHGLFNDIPHIGKTTTIIPTNPNKSLSFLINTITG